jgi:hypothetical protein
VTVHFEEDTTGTLTRVRHGNYADNPTGHERRQEHLDGWMYFLGRLEALSC